jgi:hypothetical protein
MVFHSPIALGVSGMIIFQDKVYLTFCFLLDFVSPVHTSPVFFFLSSSISNSFKALPHHDPLRLLLGEPRRFCFVCFLGFRYQPKGLTLGHNGD